MKKFCECSSECNSEWILGARARHGQVALDCTQENSLLGWKEYQAKLDAYKTCPVCGFWHWYDAQYENMMFDLKEMNKG